MKERLIGGMALPRGVLFMTEERLAAGYYDEEGQLRLHTQPVSLHRFRWAGLLGRAILLLLEAWRLEADRVGANAVLAGANAVLLNRAARRSAGKPSSSPSTGRGYPQP